VVNFYRTAAQKAAFFCAQRNYIFNYSFFGRFLLFSYLRFMDYTTEEINSLVGKILQDWQVMILQELEIAIIREGLTLTGELRNSIRSEVESEKGGLESQLRLYFTDYGRFKDMKNLRYREKMPPPEKMLEYVRKVGIANFRYAFGYPLGVMPTTPSKSKYLQGATVAEARAAYSVAKSLTGTAKRKKEKAWYSKTVYSNLRSLQDKLIEMVRENTISAMKKSLQP
jgi:hypothetical protein